MSQYVGGLPDGLRDGAEIELDDHAPVRQAVGVHAPADVPHQEACVEVVGADLAPSPALAPLAEPLDHRAELLPGGRQEVLAPAPLRPRRAPDDSGVLELRQSLGEQGP